jgi:hypothetical protein
MRLRKPKKKYILECDAFFTLNSKNIHGSLLPCDLVCLHFLAKVGGALVVFSD